MERRSAVAAAAMTATAAVAVFSLGADAKGPQQGQRGFFNSPCEFTHRAMDDPIVFPNQAGASHSHDFFGNPSTNAASTLDSMSAVAGRCARAGDRAGYWVPTLYKGSQIVRPLRSNVYYRTAGRDPAAVQTFPTGLKVVAGNAKATGPQDPKIVRWGCTKEATPRLLKLGAPLCPRGTNLRLSIAFPDCWNGRDLDSADHKSHMAYSGFVRRMGRVCPTTHPVAVPKLVLNVPYATRGGFGLKLASGPIHTAHGDFFNAWEPAALRQLVTACLNADVHCEPPRRMKPAG